MFPAHAHICHRVCPGTSLWCEPYATSWLGAFHAALLGFVFFMAFVAGLVLCFAARAPGVFFEILAPYKYNHYFLGHVLLGYAYLHSDNRTPYFGGTAVACLVQGS